MTAVTSRNDRLSRNALGLPQIVASTLANIAPAVGFYFGFGTIVGGAGVAAPLTIVIAMVSILLLSNTLSEFTRYSPSAGSFVTYIGMAFGPVAGAAASLFTVVGYAVAAAAIVAIAGGWTHDTLKLFLGVDIPWQAIAVLSTVGCGVLVTRGVRISTTWAAVCFYFELALLLVGAVAILVVNHDALSLDPFRPSNLSGGLAGVGLGFPLAVYMFIGWENSATLAEETEDPRRNIPRALVLGTLALGAVFVFLAYATEIAFHNDAKAISGAAIPFIDALKASASPLLILAYLAGLTSILSCLLGLTNSQARILFSAGREGLLPRVFGRIDPRHDTPAVAMWSYIGLATLIALGFGAFGGLEPIDIFGQTGTLGTIPIVIVYLVTNVALPVYILRFHRADFSVLRHAVIPALALVLTLFPLWGLVQPGQPSPFNLFPLVSAVGLLVAIVYGVVLASRDPDLARKIPERAGGVVYNSVAVAMPGGDLLTYRKCHLFGPKEKACFAAGTEPSPVFELCGLRTGLLVCYDVEFPEMVRRMALAGAQLLLVPTALPRSAPNDRVSRALVPARALENHLFIGYAGLCGRENGLDYQGGSVIVGPDGEDLARAGAGPALLIADLVSEPHPGGQPDPYLQDRRPELYQVGPKGVGV